MSNVRISVAAGLTALVLNVAPAAYAAPESPVSAAQIEAAKTPVEHEAIAKMFEDEAASLTTKSEMHAEMAKTYSLPGGKPYLAALAKHCTALENDYRAAAKQNLALAAIHRKMAKEATK